MAFFKTWRQLTKLQRKVILILISLVGISLWSHHGSSHHYKSQLTFNLMKEKYGEQTSVASPGPECTIGIIADILTVLFDSNKFFIK